jgi:hypothetical protein
VADLKIKWWGIDGAGYAYGFYQDGATHHQVDIAIPGRGTKPQPGPDFRIYVNGKRIGTKASLGEAAALAERYFREGRHRVARQHREISGTGPAPPRERRSLKQILSAYVGVKLKGRGR